jgi:hypothetical protein
MAFKPNRVSADEPPVGATWKLRAIVYGLLLVIGVLVLAARSGGESGSEPTIDHTLRGTTSQGSQVAIGMNGRHVSVISLSHIDRPCGQPYSWQPAIGQAGVGYEERGHVVEVRERWPGTESNIHVLARVYNAGHNIDGTVVLSAGGCRSGPVRFSASG